VSYYHRWPRKVEWCCFRQFELSCMVTSGDMTQLKNILFLSHYQRWTKEGTLVTNRIILICVKVTMVSRLVMSPIVQAYWHGYFRWHYTIINYPVCVTLPMVTKESRLVLFLAVHTYFLWLPQVMQYSYKLSCLCHIAQGNQGKYTGTVTSSSSLLAWSPQVTWHNCKISYLCHITQSGQDK
jgi:hypothetical protein